MNIMKMDIGCINGFTTFLSKYNEIVMLTCDVIIELTNGTTIYYIKLYGPHWPQIPCILKALIPNWSGLQWEEENNKCISIYESHFDMKIVIS